MVFVRAWAYALTTQQVANPVLKIVYTSTVFTIEIVIITDGFRSKMEGVQRHFPRVSRELKVILSDACLFTRRIKKDFLKIDLGIVTDRQEKISFRIQLSFRPKCI